MTWLLLLVVALGCASQDQQQQASQRETVGSVSQAIVTTCGSSAVPATTTWVQPGYTIWENHDSFIVPVGSAPTDNLDIEFTEPSGITGVYVNWLCVRAYLRSTTGNITYLGTSTVTAGTHTCAAGTCLRRVSYDMSAVTPGTYEVLLAADDQNTTFLRRTIDVLEATFPPVQYRQVTYARDIDEHFAFPTLTPPATPLFSPELRRPNHFIFNVPTKRAVTLQIDVGNSAAALDLMVTDSRRTVIKSTAVPSSVTGHQLTAVSLGTLNPGNYELDLAPRNEAQTYKVSSGDAAIPIALKDGADLAQPGTSLYFFVPAEAETVFLLGAFDSTSAARFFSPEANGPEVTPVSIGSGVYALDTRGKPGIWRTTYQTTASRAHFINLPEIYSFDANAVIASTRIRTAMDLGPVLTSPVELPYLRPDNHFVFHVATAASPSFNIAVEDASLPSATLSVKLLDSSGGNLWTGSLPVGATNPVSAGLLQPGDYELHVKNPNGTTRYLITVPAGITFASVDDVRLGNIWLARYRQYFTVSAGAPPIRFFADGSGAIFTIYKPDGTSIGQPTALGHNLYDIPNPGAVYGTWAMNVKGTTNVRFLNVPQVIGWNPTFQASLPPAGIIQCTTTADCPTGQVCGTDNGAQFGLAATADVCWLPTCNTAQAPPDSCGSTLSPCGTCTCNSCAARTCGDEAVNSCAPTTCPHLCHDGQGGCTTDLDCPSGSVCGIGIGQRFGLAEGTNVCWKQSCAIQDPSTPNCGVGSACGTCPACLPHCAAGSTGPNGCGGFCGACPAGIERAPDGTCPLVARELRLPPEALEDLPFLETQEAGALGGQFKVTDRGTAAYTIPIQVPPGRLGMSPSLALRYASVKTNGFLGIGWSLSGLSAISRCPSIVDRDGTARPVMMNGGDRLCLDGQPLVRPVGSSEYFADGAVYSTEIDSFSKIVSHGFTSTTVNPFYSGPDYFEVFTKDGRILTFGRTEDSSVRAWAGVDAGREGGAYLDKRIWALNSIRDRSDNEITITYQRNAVVGDKTDPFDGATAEIVPLVISYGKNDSQQLGNSRYIKFAYEKRPDPRFHFVAGTRAASSLRLTTITTYVGSDPLNRYHFNYQPRADRESQVSRITYCADEGDHEKCLKPTSFAYRETQSELTLPVQFRSALPSPVRGIVPLDMDGDGRSELLQAEGQDWLLVDPSHPSSVQGSQAAITTSTAQGCVTAMSVMDVNRDGRDDVVDLCPGGSGYSDQGRGEAVVYYSNGNEAPPFDRETLGFTFTGRLIPADVDGDGLKDLVECADPEVASEVYDNAPIPERALILSWLHRNLGVGFSSEPLPSPAIGTDDFGPGLCADLEAVDVDGDGDEEIVQFRSTSGRVAVWSPNWIHPETHQRWIWRDYGAITACAPLSTGRPWAPCANSTTYKLVDANGDGLRDLAYERP
ncbi:MAG: SpvB/TcaC N-terminal domain-containing protein, partial [Myxococcales bacterium]